MNVKVETTTDAVKDDGAVVAAQSAEVMAPATSLGPPDDFPTETIEELTTRSVKMIVEAAARRVANIVDSAGQNIAHLVDLQAASIASSTVGIVEDTNLQIKARAFSLDQPVSITVFDKRSGETVKTTLPAPLPGEPFTGYKITIG